ncbi:MAG: NADPH-dependent FMN reductase [Chitinophagales bacterium]
MNIVVISGSVRIGRETHKVAEYLTAKLKENTTAYVHLIDLMAYPLPIMEETYGNLKTLPEGLIELQKLLHQADAMIWVSPEYHGTCTGALKNMLDYFWVEFYRKPIGVAAAATGRMGGINASTSMQQLVLSVGAYAMPLKLIVPFVDKAFDENGLPVEGDVEKGFVDFTSEFLWFAEAIVAKKMVVSA